MSEVGLYGDDSLADFSVFVVNLSLVEHLFHGFLASMKGDLGVLSEDVENGMVTLTLGLRLLIWRMR